MKKTTIIWLSVFFAANLILAEESCQDLDKGIETAVINMTSQVDRVVFLSLLIANNQQVTLEKNLQKATVIRMLGKYGGTNAVPILVENLDFKDMKRHDTPSVIALIGIGESAVQPLLEVVKTSENKERIALAVQVLMAIKGAHYDAFVEKQKGHMNADTWKNLLRYAIED